MKTMKNLIEERKNAWNKKEVLANTAKQHTKEMQDMYAEEIKKCIENSTVYSGLYLMENEIKRKYNSTEFVVADADSVTAVLQFSSKNSKVTTAVLNFASYKFPGGMFLEGSKAQEEALCHESFLYNVLSDEKFNCYYAYNKKHLNRALYHDRGIYSPDVIFERNDLKTKADVITCAAPNFATAYTYQSVMKKENSESLRNRIDFLLSMAAANEVDNLILGAFGSGVFGQDATEVAEIFKMYLKNKYERAFKKVIFAVPSGNGNYEAFVNTFVNVDKVLSSEAYAVVPVPGYREGNIY